MLPPRNTQSADVVPPLQSASHKHLSLRKHNRRSIFSERGIDSPIKLDEYEFPSFELQEFGLWESLQHDVARQAQTTSHSVEVTAHQPSRWRFLRTDWWKTQLAKIGIREHPEQKDAEKDINVRKIMVARGSLRPIIHP